MPMERAPFGCLTDKPSRYMITPMLKCVTPDLAESGQKGERSFRYLYLIQGYDTL